MREIWKAVLGDLASDDITAREFWNESCLRMKGRAGRHCWRKVATWFLQVARAIGL